MTAGALAWQSQAPLFFAAEIDTYAPGGVAFTPAEGIGTTPRGTLAQLEQPIAASYTIRVSDLGYRSPPVAGAVSVYPPYLDTAFAINRQLQLDPLASAVSETWGSIVLLNPAGQFDAIAASNNTDTRGVRIFAGRKIPATDGRAILLDPAYSALTPLFSGMAQTWQLTETALTVPIRDPAYWLTVPLQRTLYGGTGGLDGTATLAGTPKPKVRGGTGAAPVKNVTPTLLDPVNLIYQYTDGPGTITTLYEGGDGANILASGDVADLYSGATPAGHYRTNNARGLFQLGSNPASGRIITVDCTGAFPVAGVVSTPIALAKNLILEDAALPASYVDAAAWTAADALCPYVAGVFFDPKSNTTADSAVTLLLGAVNARLLCSRAGLLRPYLMRVLAVGVVAGATFSPDNTISVTRQVLPSTLDPPPGSWRVGYGRNYTQQTTGLSPAALPATVTYLAQTDLYASAASTAVLSAYQHPNYPDPLAGALLDMAGAQAVANALVALWSARRRVYSVVVPLALGLASDIGDTIRLQWPVEDLGAGQLGQIVGEATRSSDSTMTFQVLI